MLRVFYINMYNIDTHLCVFLVQNNNSLKALRLTGNKIGNRGGMFLAQMLQINTALEALDVGDTDLVCTVKVQNFLTTEMFAVITLKFKYLHFDCTRLR